MKKGNYCYLLLFILSFSCFQFQLQAQTLVSSTYKGQRSKAQLISQLGVPFIQYSVKYYKITYRSVDAQGMPDTLSGLLVVPDQADKTFPRLVYQHGTSSCKTCVPSRYGSAGGGEGEIGLLFAGMGYISLLPDYVGMGDGRGFHPYVHAETEARAAIDFLAAHQDWNSQQVPKSNDQLFITGYSQGGHAGMALHRELEAATNPAATVTAAAHLSGPYSISGIMRQQILSESPYFYPAYIPNTALSYQTVYGNLFTELTDLFKPEYASLIQQYYEGNIDLVQLNQSLIQTLTALTGASVPRRMFQDAAVAAIESDPLHPVNVALADNDVYQWAPESPTRIFYCMADDQVPFMNSVVARDSMLAKGATNLAAADLDPTADHGGCVAPALTQTIIFFAGFQQITTHTEAQLEDLESVVIQPNPTSDQCMLSPIASGSSIRLVDLQGRVLKEYLGVEEGTFTLSVAGLPVGCYYVQVVSASQGVVVKKLMVGTP